MRPNVFWSFELSHELDMVVNWTGKFASHESLFFVKQMMYKTKIYD